MRIIHVLAVLSPDNVYGGPATVAVDQCRALAAAGHDITLIAGAMGFEEDLPSSIDGAPVKLFPARTLMPGTGFAGLAAPGLEVWLARQARNADAVHVHLARDLLTLPAAALAQALGARVHVQTHGMIDPSDSALAKVLDVALTRRVLRRAENVFCLTEAEVADVHQVAGPAVKAKVLPNGILVDHEPPARPEGSPNVLFLARLAPRKRPGAFVRAALELAPEFPDVTFTLVGPDEGAADEVQRLIRESGLGERIEWRGPAGRAQCAAYMEAADLYVLPSVNEPFGMTVLEALRAGIPAIVTDSCELGPMLIRSGSGAVSGPEPSQLAEAMRPYLRDAGLRRAAGERAFATVSGEFSIGAIRDQLLDRYGSPQG
ncbi:glycosyltransferase [Luteococcus sanguinis]|uniref:Glycosyltransferase n=1 Tax=Luteococcus sanguinis TaxID=174038 RepID=A0ABW1X3G4_9ACTN